MIAALADAISGFYSVTKCSLFFSLSSQPGNIISLLVKLEIDQNKKGVVQDSFRSNQIN